MVARRGGVNDYHFALGNELSVAQGFEDVGEACSSDLGDAEARFNQIPECQSALEDEGAANPRNPAEERRPKAELLVKSCFGCLKQSDDECVVVVAGGIGVRPLDTAVDDDRGARLAVHGYLRCSGRHNDCYVMLTAVIRAV